MAGDTIQSRKTLIENDFCSNKQQCVFAFSESASDNIRIPVRVSTFNCVS